MSSHHISLECFKTYNLKVGVNLHPLGLLLCVAGELLFGRNHILHPLLGYKRDECNTNTEVPLASACINYVSPDV